jgi:hypothetical protein
MPALAAFRFNPALRTFHDRRQLKKALYYCWQGGGQKGIVACNGEARRRCPTTRTWV